MTQDYSGQNLRGRSFRGQNLEGANFSGADIRSADFTNANLTGANFSYATAGLQKRWAIFLVSVAWLLSGVSGFFSSLAGILVSSLFDNSTLESQASGLTCLITIIVLFAVIIRQGMNANLAFAFAFALAGGIAFALAIFFAELIAVVIIRIVAGTVEFHFLSLGLVVGGGVTLTIAVGGAALVSISITLAVAIAVGGAIAGVIAIAVVVAAPVFITGLTVLIGNAAGAEARIVAGTVAGTVIFSLLGIYIARQALKGDEKYTFFLNKVVVFTALNGTSFHYTDLTDVDFTQASLKSTDFRKANLTRTRFQKVKMLDRVRPGQTYLQKAGVRQLLVTGQGQDKKFESQDLRGVNLQGANLADASFIGSNLSEASLQDTDLFRAKLVQTQLDRTDFTGATLTGAYIQDWGITTDTKFDGVRCEYVYMRLPTKENPDPLRKPDNRQEVFAPGEFGDFIKPIFDTLDLYHAQGVDPRAIATAFKELAENNPSAELEIIAIERRGEDKVLLRAKTAPSANKSELSKEYFISYNQIKALAENDFRALIANQKTQIRELTNMIKTALQRPGFYAQTYINQGDTAVAGDRNINTSGDYYEQSGNLGIGHMSGGEIKEGAKVAGTINEAERHNLAQAAAEIQALLKQLEQTYPTTTTSQQMVVATEAINQIESNPTLKQRVINAVKEGGLAAFEKAIDNPAGAFIVAAIKGWQEVEAQD